MADHPEVNVLTGPQLDELWPGYERHEWEQALAALNKTGEMSQPSKTHRASHHHCCGRCRADRYYVRRKDKRR